MATSKPSLSNGIWGSTGSITDPGATKTQQGWIGEFPDPAKQNWWQERADEMLFHINEEGIPVWDAATDYPVNGYAKGSDGNIYKSLQTPNINQDPVSTPAYWENIFSNSLQPATSTEAENLTVGDKYISPLTFPDGFKGMYGGFGTDGTHQDISGQDLNNLLKNGIYNGENLVNGPDSHWYFVNVMVHSNNTGWATQVLHPMTGGTIYFRRRVSSTWGDWSIIPNIVSSGINANGRYISYNNSTPSTIMTGGVTVSYSGSSPVTTVTLPIAFSGTGYRVSICPAGSNIVHTSKNWSITNLTTTSFQIVGYSNNVFSEFSHWTAILI